MKEIFEKYQCWNDRRISQVINTEAASLKRAAFLATHMPLRQLDYQRSLYRKVEDISENGLLKELHNCANEGEHAFVVVLGAPGTGKSHLIRWLKDRYELEREPQEKVLFIERAQGSLKGTLQQIIQSEIFKQNDLDEQTKRLEKARTALSEDALSNDLTNGLLTMSKAHPEIEMPMWFKGKEKYFDMFLLDITIREELQKPGGAIDRLQRFLTEGYGGGMNANEEPRFEARDFDFEISPSNFSGYWQVQTVLESLQRIGKGNLREELASYLNRLLPYTIGHATALTSDDFKQIFYDLRRHLHHRNQQLVLFIEDITSLTGVDGGLVDVLVTQHIGETNQEFCRLTAVVGITNDFYNSSFPDNMKDRVTHRIALDLDAGGTQILQDPDAVADMAARYLNAIRLDQADLERWLEEGAPSDHIPNACKYCQWKGPCHGAFGTRSLSADDTSHGQQLGLYPFNEHALWQFYRHATNGYLRTPRTLLNDVLRPILQSHGPSIKLGLFPPVPADLGSQFSPFTLAKPLQRKLIEAQAKLDAKRVESLITIWGNSTIDAVQNETGYLVGGLSKGVFKAFGLPPIDGELVEESFDSPPQAADNTHSLVQLELESVVVSDLITGQDIPYEKSDPLEKYRADINSWFNGGILEYYEDYRTWLQTFIRDSIDWSFYNISNFQVTESLSPRHIYIKGQAGQRTAEYSKEFERSREMADVLYSLVVLKKGKGEHKPRPVGGYLATLSLWLHRQKESIVSFVRQPNDKSPNAKAFGDLLLLDCLFLAVFRGTLQTKYASTSELFLDVVGTCIEFKTSKQQELHSFTWAQLKEKFTDRKVKKIHTNLLKVLNCPQGASQDVRFIDASTALDVLEDFRQQNWHLPSANIVGSLAEKSPWNEVYTIYEELYKNFVQALREEHTNLTKQLEKIEQLTEWTTPDEVFTSIDRVLNKLRTSNRGFTFQRNSDLSSTELQQTMDNLRVLQTARQKEDLILQLSKAELTERAEIYRQYLQDFINEMNKHFGKVTAERDKRRNDIASIDFPAIQEQIQDLYTRLRKLLASVVVEKDVQ